MRVAHRVLAAEGVAAELGAERAGGREVARLLDDPESAAVGRARAGGGGGGGDARALELADGSPVARAVVVGDDADLVLVSAARLPSKIVGGKIVN